MLRRSLLSIVLIASALSSSRGQSLSTLPRATVATGLNDSTLVMIADSARRTRAARALDFRAMLSLRGFDSLATATLRLPGVLNLTGGSITGSPSATLGAITVSSCVGCAPAVVDSAVGANRAQKLTTARTIGGTSFDGTANITPALSDSATGSARAQVLTTARTIGGTSFNGSANIVPGLADSATGADRAQKLTTARTINGTSFDGTANVTVTAAAGTVTGATLNSGVTASSLTSFGVAARTDSATGATRAQILTTARTIGGTSFNGSANIVPAFSDSSTGAARASALVGSPAITVSSCTGCGGGVIVSDTVRSVTFDSVRAVRVRADTLRSTTGASKRIVVQATTSGSALSTVMTLADTAVTFSPSNSRLWLGSGGPYLQAIATDTLGLGYTNGAAAYRFSGGKIIGPAGNNTTILAGTGNSRTLTLQFTNASGTALNGIVLNADTSITFATNKFSMNISGANPYILAPNFRSSTVGTVGATPVAYHSTNRTTTGIAFTGADSVALAANGVQQLVTAPSGVLVLPLLPAEGSTKNAMCWDATTKNVTQNGAATCTVSSARFKENIIPLTPSAAWNIVARPQLHSSTYRERNGGRLAIGIVAEQADSADTRLASRDGTGLITSTNYEEVTSLLLTIVKDQQRQLDSLKLVLSPWPFDNRSVNIGPAMEVSRDTLATYTFPHARVVKDSAGLVQVKLLPIRKP